MITNILEYAEKANVLLPVLLFIVVVVYIRQVVKFFDEWKMRKVNTLSSLYENKYLLEDTKDMIKDEINNAVFKSVLGIRVETTLRKQLMDLHKKDKNTFTWKRLRMSANYFDYETKEIVIKIGWFEKLNSFTSLLGVVSAIVMYIVTWTLFVLQMNLENFINVLIYTSISGPVFFFCGYELAQLYHAKKLKKALENLRLKIKSSTCKA